MTTPLASLCSGHSYSLRVDVGLVGDDESINQLLDLDDQAFLDRAIEDFIIWVSTIVPLNSLSKHLVALEVAPDSGKPHWQGILWFDNLLTPNNSNQIRQWFKQWASHTYQPVSFKKAIKPESLSAYCMKSLPTVMNTSMSLLEIESIPKWRETLGKKAKAAELAKKRRIQFEKACFDYLKNKPDPYSEDSYQKFYHSEYGTQCSAQEAKSREMLFYLTEFSQIYFAIYQSPIRRMSGIMILLKTGILDHDTYIRSLYGNFFAS